MKVHDENCYSDREEQNAIIRAVNCTDDEIEDLKKQVDELKSRLSVLEMYVGLIPFEVKAEFSKKWKETKWYLAGIDLKKEISL